ncbi:MAG TPA: type II toxin-antitoxin system RelE/ParE family toxin [Elusimicrobia bacterium]|nr:type II toxin-antitoxin system RelE/ParE family toxin [Elusimicrobiota bacterium]
MTWTVLFHPLVLSEDLPGLDARDRGEIFKAIRKKLTVAPEQYGEPLRRELFGYWKLRVGGFRVIYKISGKTVTVLVLKVGFRRDGEIYEGMARRLKRSV